MNVILLYILKETEIVIKFHELYLLYQAFDYQLLLGKRSLNSDFYLCKDLQSHQNNLLLFEKVKHFLVTSFFVSNSKFNYILKYVCKSGHVPKWVRRRKAIRIFQSGKGFLTKTEKAKTSGNRCGTKGRRLSTTIGERIDNFGKTALIIEDRFLDRPVKYRQLQLKDDFKILLDRLVYSIARDGRYLGDGKIIIEEQEDFYPWISLPNQ